MLLTPLGYADEERLVGISSVHRVESLQTRGNFLPDFWFWREHATSLDAVAFHGWRSWTLADADRVERVESVAVSSNLFGVLGVEPLLGRDLLPEDETPVRAASSS